MNAQEDQRLDQVVSVVLRTGVVLAAALVLIGGLAFLAARTSAAPDYRKFHTAPHGFLTIHGVLNGALSLNPLYIIQLGLLVLIATPVVRVLTCAAGFALERDWTYTVISLIVLAFLLASIIGSGL